MAEAHASISVGRTIVALGPTRNSYVPREFSGYPRGTCDAIERRRRHPAVLRINCIGSRLLLVVHAMGATALCTAMMFVGRILILQQGAAIFLGWSYLPRFGLMGYFTRQPLENLEKISRFENHSEWKSLVDLRRK